MWICLPASVRPHRNTVAFFFLGLLNNLTYVVNNAGAGDILPDSIAVIYIINTLPELALKATAPFWWHCATYKTKVRITGCCFSINLVLVSAGLGFPVWAQLLGVALSDLGGGLGEASVLALSQFYDRPGVMLSAWSSGTGAAGVVGYLLSMFVLPLLPVAGRLVLATCIVCGYWTAFFWMLEAPWIDRVRAGRTGRNVVLPVALATEATEAMEACDGGDGMSNGGGLGRQTAYLTTPYVRSLPTPPATTSDAPITAPTAAGSPDLAASLWPADDKGSQADVGLTHGAGSDAADPAAEFDLASKLRMQRGLLRYVMPLVLVYWAEYAAQSGAWTAFALPASAPLNSSAARHRAYQYFNLLYQVGVLISRSSGRLFTLSLGWLWALAGLQVAMLVLFGADGATQLLVGYVLLLPAMVVGLLGGVNYVQTFMAIDRELPPRLRELALSTASVGSPVGILLANVSGLFIQWCLWQSLSISEEGSAGGHQCPLPIKSGNLSTYVKHI